MFSKAFFYRIISSLFLLPCFQKPSCFGLTAFYPCYNVFKGLLVFDCQQFILVTMFSKAVLFRIISILSLLQCFQKPSCFGLSAFYPCYNAFKGLLVLDCQQFILVTMFSKAFLFRIISILSVLKCFQKHFCLGLSAFYPCYNVFKSLLVSDYQHFILVTMFSKAFLFRIVRAQN